MVPYHGKAIFEGQPEKMGINQGKQELNGRNRGNGKKSFKSVIWP